VKLKPARFFLVAVVLTAALFIAAHEAHSPACRSQTGSWFVDLLWILGPLIVAAVFGGTLSRLFQRESGVVETVGSLILAVFIAGVWTLIGLYVILVLLLGNCLST
jgi:hypothetical protein